MPKGFDRRALLLYAAAALAVILWLVYFLAPEEAVKNSSPLLAVPKRQAEDFSTSKTVAYNRKQQPSTSPKNPVKLNLNLSKRASKQETASTISPPTDTLPKPQMSKKKPIQSIPSSRKPQKRANTGFYGWSKQPSVQPNSKLYTLATIDNDQVVQQGAKVRIRLLEDMVIQGVEVPRNTFLIGMIERHTDRIDIIVPHMKVQEQPIAVSLFAYDEQYNRGIFISTEQEPSLQNELGSELLDEATAAIPLNRVASMAGKLLSRKTRKGEKIVIPAGFRIFLKQSTSDEKID